MARVAVLHNTLDFQGGADRVALTACSCLSRTHDVDLVTISETDHKSLAERFGLDVDVRLCEPSWSRTIASVLARFAPHIGAQLALRSAIVKRAFDPIATEYELVVSTTNELSLPIPSVQYVHFPQFELHRLADAEPGRINRIWSRVAAPTDISEHRLATYVANSAWTADAFEHIYGLRPRVLYPPVCPIPTVLDWEAREQGIVLLGRIAPDRRVHAAIEIVDRLRGRGYDLHLHLVGSAPRAYRQYHRAVRRLVATRSYVTIETDVPRSRIVDLLGTHRYGLNVRPRESFGIAVAEYVAAGMIPFAPNAGGQREILQGRGDRLFTDPSDAVEKLARAIDERHRPEFSPNRFRPERFERGLSRLVAARLGES